MSNVSERTKKALQPFIEDFRKQLMLAKVAGISDGVLANITRDALMRAGATFTDDAEILAWLTEQFRQVANEVPA